MCIRSPQPPFCYESALKKVRLAEDAWNSRDPFRVAQAYTYQSQWRNRSCFLQGRDEIQAFLKKKWAKEHEYRLIKSLWGWCGHRIAVRFAYEWRDSAGQWWRSYGNENWEFAPNGQMSVRHASINDVMITQDERCLVWEGGKRPDDFPSMEELGL